MALSLLNVAALVTLVVFHFHGDGSKPENVAVQAQPHYLLKETPRIAMIPAQRSGALLAKDVSESISEDHSQRWIF
ncbi:hypothetical protein [Pseudomonas sp.]|uniref:hypothetical protein n=1 Tax=Pseudomonas sp. TaxID=306 RepID=UPI002EDA25A1